ncbi:MAG: AI-2E family transporter [Acidobacteriota bacterium]|nr:AI-2E family transporter [Acidobacteriota bacterium]
MADRDTPSYLLLSAASFVVLIAGLRAADTIAIPVLVALFAGILSLPLLFWLQAKGVPRTLAIVATMLAATGLLVAAGFLLGTAVTKVAAEVPVYQEGLREVVSQGVEWIRARGVAVETADFFNPDAILDMATATMGRVAALAQDTILVALITVFLLFEAASFPDKLQAAFGERSEMVERLRRVTDEVQRYLVLKTFMSALLGVGAYAWTWATGVDYPVFWGLLGFVMHYIPNIGAFLGAIPAVLLALVQYGVGRATVVAIGFVVMDTILGNLVEPPLMGRRFGLSPLVVFLSLVFWGWVWGPVGMLLSVPLTIILKIILEGTRDWRWLAVLLGRGPEKADAT